MLSNKTYMETREQLRKVFQALRKRGLVARMNFLCCSSCASSELLPVVKEKGKVGAVYFHKQDNSQFIENGTLHLRYFSNTDWDSAFEIGTLIQKELGKAGLVSAWDGDTGKTIIVKVV